MAENPYAQGIHQPFMEQEADWWRRVRAVGNKQPGFSVYEGAPVLGYMRQGEVLALQETGLDPLAIDDALRQTLTPYEFGPKEKRLRTTKILGGDQPRLVGLMRFEGHFTIRKKIGEVVMDLLGGQTIMNTEYRLEPVFLIGVADSWRIASTVQQELKSQNLSPHDKVYLGSLTAVPQGDVDRLWFTTPAIRGGRRGQGRHNPPRKRKPTVRSVEVDQPSLPVLPVVAPAPVLPQEEQLRPQVQLIDLIPGLSPADPRLAHLDSIHAEVVLLGKETRSPLTDKVVREQMGEEGEAALAELVRLGLLSAEQRAHYTIFTIRRQASAGSED